MDLQENYAFGCETKCEERKRTLSKNPTEEEVRRYFLINHNIMTLNKAVNKTQLGHLAIPYEILPSGIAIIANPFYPVPKFLETIKDVSEKHEASRIMGLTLPQQLEEIIILHNETLVDTMSKLELNKYIIQDLSI